MSSRLQYVVFHSETVEDLIDEMEGCVANYTELLNDDFTKTEDARVYMSIEESLYYLRKYGQHQNKQLSHLVELPDELESAIRTLNIEIAKVKHNVEKYKIDVKGDTSMYKDIVAREEKKSELIQRKEHLRTRVKMERQLRNTTSISDIVSDVVCDIV
jgi:hypothetical protein